MIRPKKATEHKYHISIVRANKRQVNDAFVYQALKYIKLGYTFLGSFSRSEELFWVIMFNVELNCDERCIPYENMTSPERLDWMNPL